MGLLNAIARNPVLNGRAVEKQKNYSGSAGPKKDGFVERLVAYIPAGIVALYVFGVNTVGAGDAAGISFVFWVCFVLCPMAGIAGALAAKRDIEWFRVVVGPIAFLFWALSLGARPLGQMDWLTAGRATFVMAVVTIAIPIADELIDAVAARGEKG